MGEPISPVQEPTNTVQNPTNLVQEPSAPAETLLRTLEVELSLGKLVSKQSSSDNKSSSNPQKYDNYQNKDVSKIDEQTAFAKGIGSEKSVAADWIVRYLWKMPTCVWWIPWVLLLPLKVSRHNFQGAGQGQGMASRSKST